MQVVVRIYEWDSLRFGEYGKYSTVTDDNLKSGIKFGVSLSEPNFDQKTWIYYFSDCFFSSGLPVPSTLGISLLALSFSTSFRPQGVLWI